LAKDPRLQGQPENPTFIRLWHIALASYKGLPDKVLCEMFATNAQVNFGIWPALFQNPSAEMSDTALADKL